MFIERGDLVLRPSVRRAMFMNMALLAEGEMLFGFRVYKHGPPDGGRNALGFGSINMALLTEGEMLLVSGL